MRWGVLLLACEEGAAMDGGAARCGGSMNEFRLLKAAEV